MENFIEAIRAATTDNASDEARATGAQACRMILQVLEVKPGEPMASAVATPTSTVATGVSALRGLSIDQLLDLAIAKLRTALPAGTIVPEVEPLKISLVTPASITRQP